MIVRNKATWHSDMGYKWRGKFALIKTDGSVLSRDRVISKARYRIPGENTTENVQWVLVYYIHVAWQGMIIRAPLAKISLSDSAWRGTSPSAFDLLCFHVHTAIPFATNIFLFVSRVNKTDVAPQMRLRNWTWIKYPAFFFLAKTDRLTPHRSLRHKTSWH